MLHKYGALSFWDYATAAPYVVVDMNPKPPGDDAGLCKKDAIFFSMHKVRGLSQIISLEGDSNLSFETFISKSFEWWKKFAFKEFAGG